MNTTDSTTGIRALPPGRTPRPPADWAQSRGRPPVTEAVPRHQLPQHQAEAVGQAVEAILAELASPADACVRLANWGQGPGFPLRPRGEHEGARYAFDAQAAADALAELRRTARSAVIDRAGLLGRLLDRAAATLDQIGHRGDLAGQLRAKADTQAEGLRAALEQLDQAAARAAQAARAHAAVPALSGPPPEDPGDPLSDAVLDAFNNIDPGLPVALLSLDANEIGAVLDSLPDHHRPRVDELLAEAQAAVLNWQARQAEYAEALAAWRQTNAARLQAEAALAEALEGLYGARDALLGNLAADNFRWVAEALEARADRLRLAASGTATKSYTPDDPLREAQERLRPIARRLHDGQGDASDKAELRQLVDEIGELVRLSRGA